MVSNHIKTTRASQMPIQTMKMKTIHALIIGVDLYGEDGKDGRLRLAESDASEVEKVIKEPERPWHVGTIYALLGKSAKKEEILPAFEKLSASAKRDDIFLFYFSGYSGTVAGEEDKGGYICPVDFSKKGGISEKSLISAFDQLSKSHGNNIVSYLQLISRNSTIKSAS